MALAFTLAHGAEKAQASGTSAAAGTVLVLPVGSESDVVLLQHNAAAPLREAGLGVATMDDAELSGFDAEATLECLASDGGECEHLLRKAPAKWVLLLRIRHSGDDQAENEGEASEALDEDQTIIAKLYAANDASLLQVEQRHCQRCSSRERMAKLTSELVAEIAAAELANQATETYVTINSTPSSAILSIDGTVVGPTGQAYRVAPGEHKISVTSEGYRKAEQTVSIAANENKAITVGLGLEGMGSANASRGRTIITWSTLAVGTVALGAGVAWIVVDGNTTGDARDDLRSTKTLGISSMIAGTVLLGAGIALMLTETEASGEMQVSAAPSSDGFAIGLSGHF